MKILTGVIAIILMLLFVFFPSVQIKGAVNGLLICSDIIIPSLFPFTALALFLFSCGFTKYFERVLDNI